MSKHTKLFYRAIARIRAVGKKNGAVYLHRIKTKLNTDYLKASRLKDELVKAGILKEWDLSSEIGKPKKKKAKGNIIWENLSRYRVPKEITLKEKARVMEERKRGLL